MWALTVTTIFIFVSRTEKGRKNRISLIQRFTPQINVIYPFPRANCTYDVYINIGLDFLTVLLPMAAICPLSAFHRLNVVVTANEQVGELNFRGFCFPDPPGRWYWWYFWHTLPTFLV
ncbi:hypothetical protein BDV38DRAFT_234969 [Aspergillus pseudotamarii]|uniref:Uncharacterized protein n=1 Tax=Aspergillus pseudotamarii TaxID=132259 RepID=A0A5N6T8D9_ASPPS|nr:uncharacterized protein BDV38DRAFT_234969 [Aspergillus pseudotamarii]KAE8142527.1 hypothetical protein BDV38DRAFT_234969 [Aspergillus pseudotamarii]